MFDLPRTQTGSNFFVLVLISSDNKQGVPYITRHIKTCILQKITLVFVVLLDFTISGNVRKREV